MGRDQGKTGFPSGEVRESGWKGEQQMPGHWPFSQATVELQGDRVRVVLHPLPHHNRTDLLGEWGHEIKEDVVFPHGKNPFKRRDSHDRTVEWPRENSGRGRK